jgi:diacylglycerol kinase (ATP)
MKKKASKIALIYNPKAGMKRSLLPGQKTLTFKDIKKILQNLELEVEYFPTKYAGHAAEIAKDLVKRRFQIVAVVGGDGTTGEVASGLIHSKTKLAILPQGSFMNIAKMLEIPLNIEEAAQIIKSGKIKKIDMGKVNFSAGKKLIEPQYFIESVGIGLEAQIFGYVQELEQGGFPAFWHILVSYTQYNRQMTKVTLDGKKALERRASLVTVSNGPIMGASLPVAPKADLTDRHFTVQIFKISKFELLKHFFWLFFFGKIRRNRKVELFHAKTVKIETEFTRKIHADGRFFGHTPIELSIIPHALSVITQK